MYQIRYDNRITKDLKPIPKSQIKVILNKIAHLASNPHPPKSEKLIGIKGWRIRVGNYRVLYQINSRAKIVTVYRIKHRREVYRIH